MSPVIAQVRGRFDWFPVVVAGDPANVVPDVATPLGAVATLHWMLLTFWVAVRVPLPVAVVEATEVAALVAGLASALPVVKVAVPDRTVLPP